MDTEDNNLGSDTYNQGLPNPVDHVITRFIARGVEKLSLEELAVTLITPDFATTFKKRTGSDWNSRLQVKVIERLTKANFDIQWMTRKTSEPNHPFFVACGRGDIDKAIAFMRKTDEDLRNAIDPSLKTGLHFAAREGHISLVEILIQKGFNVNARDRTLKTPLHYACLQGHETVADVLIKNKADIMAKDVSGRTAFHFACCGTSSRTLTLLLGTKPELINMVDNVGRTGLHYAVWNSSQRQVDIIRTVIENKGDVNAQDDDGKTPLHHASEGARSRAIPILLQKGADITIREQRTGKTALDYAPNDNIRHLIIVYSAPPYKVKDDDLRWMDQAITGQKPGPKKPGEKPKINTIDEKPPVDRMIIASFLRDKLHTIMKDIQEYGVQNAQHIKRPYIFTGSWMEGVSNVEDFSDKVSSITPLEASIRIFNIFFPYDKPYPEPKGGEPIMSSFYGDVWNFEANIPKGEGSEYQASKMRNTEEVQRLNQLVDITNQKLEDKDAELARIKKEYQALKLKADDVISKEAKGKQAEIEVRDLKRRLDRKDDELINLKAEIDKLNRLVQEQEIKIDSLEGQQADETTQIELEKAQDRVAELEKELNTAKEREKVSRYKAGQTFLSALSMKGLKGVAPAKETELNFRDDRAILKMYRALKNNPPALEARLKEQDRDTDGKLNKTEFSKAFEKLKLNPKDILSLLRVAGFYDGKELVGIQEFIKILEERPKLREKWEEDLFFKLVEHFWENEVDIENAFKLMDTSGDGVLNMVEIQEGLAKFDIKLTDKDAFALFDIFDVNDDGAIALDEFVNILKGYEQLRQNQIGAPKQQVVVQQDVVIKEDIAVNDDTQLFSGEIKVQIPSSKGIDAAVGTVYPKFYLLGATLPKVVRKVKLTPESDGTVSWGVAIKFPVIQILKDNLYDNIWVKIFNHETKEDETTYLGEFYIPWKDCIGAPAEKWPINSEYALTNKSFSKKAAKGSILVQCKWVSSDTPGFKSSNLPKKEIQPQFSAPMTDDGILEVILGSTINCWVTEDVYCELTLPNNTKKKFKAKVNREGNATWEETITFESKFVRDGQLSNISCIVYQQSPDKKMVVIGNAYLDWEACLKFPEQTNPTRAYLLDVNPKTGKPCKLYVKSKWFTKTSPSAPKIIPEKELKKQQEEKKLQNVETGLLKVNIVRAKKLLAGDGDASDSFCQIVFNGIEKIDVKTKTITTLNPNWDQHFPLKVTFSKDEKIPVLNLSVWDYDLATGNDLLGTVVVDWEKAYSSPLTWAINQYFKLENPNPQKYKGRSDFGEIYVQVYYVPPNTHDPNTEPTDIEIGNAKEELAVQKIKPVVGFLSINVVHARNLTNGEKGQVFDPVVTITYPNKKLVESDVVKNTVNPIWNKKANLPIEIPREPLEPILVEVKDSLVLRTDKLLGYVTIPWQDCLDKPGTWAINKVFNLSGNPEVIKNKKVQDFGDIYVQVKFVEHEMIDDLKEPEIIQDIALNGSLFINVIFGKGLRAADSTTSDPYVEISLPNKAKLKTSTIKETLNPIWNFKEKVPIKIPEERYQPIRFDVFDYDGFSRDDVLGYLELDWRDLINKPGEWLVNELHELDGPADIKREKNLTTFGQIYIQMRYLKDGMPETGDVPEVKFNLANYLKEQEEKMKDNVVGKLFFNIIHAKGLAASDDDISDPFCVGTLPNGTKIKTPFIQDNVNPVWDYKLQGDINILRKAVRPIKVEIWDHDKGLDRNDFLGYVQVEWEKCIEKSGSWEINGPLEIQAPPESKMIAENNKWGELYVQVKFVKLGTPDDGKEPVMAYNLEEILKTEALPIEGTLSIRTIHAKGLPVTDGILQGGKSDPYVRVVLPNDKVYETDVKSNNLNPIWNNKYEAEFAVATSRAGRPIRFEIWDQDSLKSNEKVGEVKVSFLEALENSGKWKINRLFKIQSLKENDDSNIGELYLQMRFTKKGDKPEPGEPEILYDLKKELDQELHPVEGQLLINIPHAKNLIANDKTTSDPFCKIHVPGGVKLETPYIKKTLTPIWKYKTTAKIEVPKNSANTVTVEVWDNDLVRNDCIGTVDISFLDLMMAPGKWEVNKLYDLQLPKGMDPKKAKNGLGQIYLQMRFLPLEMKNDDQVPEVTDKIEEEIKAKEEKVEGTFYINVPHAKELLAVDDSASTSDPLVKISFSDKTLQSKTLNKTLNPVWNFKDKIDFSVPKASLPPLVIHVIDHNMILSNVLIGIKEINVEEIITKPGEWFVNKSFKLTGPQHLIQKQGPTGFGDIYLQIKYVPVGGKNEGPEPDVLENIQAIIQKEKELIKGVLKFNIIHAKGLVKEDKKYKDLDTLCKVKIPTVKEISTPSVKQGDKPVWKFSKEVRIAIPQKNTDAIYLEVLNYHLVGSNDLLGYVNINFQDILTKSNTWSINQNFKLNGPEDLKNKSEFAEGFGEIYLQAKFIKDGEVDDKSTADVSENIQKLIDQEKEEVKGNLKIIVVHAKKLFPGRKLDPFCKVLIDKKEIFKTDHKPKDSNPIWKKENTSVFKSTQQDLKSKQIQFDVYDYGFWIKDKIAFVSVPAADVVNLAGKWYNKVLKLDASDEAKLQTGPTGIGDLYVQMKFMKDGVVDDGVLPENIDNLEEILQKENAPVKGKLKVYCVHVKDVIAADSSYIQGSKSDPYCKIKFPNGKTQQTSYTEQNLTAIWKQVLSQDINIMKTDVAPLKLDVIDRDKATLSDGDPLGSVTVDWKVCIDRPGEWAINEIRKLDGPPDLVKSGKYPGGFGEIYFQIQFLPEGQPDNNETGKLIVDLGPPNVKK